MSIVSLRELLPVFQNLWRRRRGCICTGPLRREISSPWPRRWPRGRRSTGASLKRKGERRWSERLSGWGTHRLSVEDVLKLVHKPIFWGIIDYFIIILVLSTAESYRGVHLPGSGFSANHMPACCTCIDECYEFDWFRQKNWIVQIK